MTKTELIKQIILTIVFLCSLFCGIAFIWMGEWMASIMLFSIAGFTFFEAMGIINDTIKKERK